mgnify:CR=1 FL=1
MDKFKKVSELTGDDSTKVEGYFTPLFGAEYAKNMVTNYKPDGKQNKVEAEDKSVKK